MNEPSTQQRLATAIGTVIIPMVETGYGIDDGPIQAFLLNEALAIERMLKLKFDSGEFKPKQP